MKFKLEIEVTAETVRVLEVRAGEGVPAGAESAHELVQQEAPQWYQTLAGRGVRVPLVLFLAWPANPIVVTSARTATATRTTVAKPR